MKPEPLPTSTQSLIRCRGIRGATFVPEDTPEAILSATRELLTALAAANGIATEDIASAFFTTTADLRSAFPARAARELEEIDAKAAGLNETYNFVCAKGARTPALIQAYAR